MFQHEKDARITKELATRLFPNEQWICINTHIFMAASRIPRNSRQSEILEKELSQARILAKRGSTIYLLPETPHSGEKHIKYSDAIVDGYVMEFKTITGGIRQVERRYKEARAKATHVFMKIDAKLTQHEITQKLSGYIKRSGYSGGVILIYFTHSGEFHQWTEEELEQKKSGSQELVPKATRRLSEENRVYRNASDNNNIA